MPSTAPNLPDILLCTLNSTYQHSSFGLRYLLANMGPLESRTQILETTIKDNPRNFVEKILSYGPRIVGFSVYIWNTRETLETIMVLKKVSPQTLIVLGGPEISYETAGQPHLKWCDYVIQGEADFSFRELCATLLNEVPGTSPLKVPGTTNPKVPGTPTTPKVIPPELPEIKQIKTPYHLYTDDDLKNRILYVEASRGCPYKCEYCLSSLDKSVRSFDLDHFLSEMKILMDRGARTFKFVDRTFNLSPTTSTRILQFFLDHIELGLFLHFELVPDRLPNEIRELIAKFPAGSLQFEIGIQTLNPDVAKNVSRKNDLVKVEENFKYLREHTKVHTHADLIVGLPGETLSSFAEGFDRLNQFAPDEIQVGILKRLKGTPISRHETTFEMMYSDTTPFQILSTSTMNYVTLQKMGRFAKFWDLYANSGEFKNFMIWLRLGDGSFFSRFFDFSEFLSRKFSETHSISLMSLSEQAWLYMNEKGVDRDTASEIIEKDFCNGPKKRDLPNFLKDASRVKTKMPLSFNQRQLNHLN